MTIPQSIKGRLLLWIFFSMVALFALLGFALQHKFKQVVFASVDRTLHSKLQLVKGLMHEDDNEIEFEVDEIALGEYIIPRSGHYYQIRVDGTVAAASISLAGEEFNLAPQLLQSYDEQAREWIYVTVGPADEPIRVIRHDFTFLNKSLSILVAESITESLTMINRITSYFFTIMLFMIVLVGVVSFLITANSLRPLQVFSAAIAKITHETLDQRIDQGDHALELQGLATAFNSLLTRLQIAFDSEKHLIADAAHELKTPLAVIKAQCDISLQNERPAAEYVESLTEIKTVADAMLRQINGMLTLARLDSGMLTASTFRQVSLPSCVRDAIRLVAPLATHKNIRITEELDEGITVLADRATLTEAMLNILENAVSYTPPGGSVAVAMESREKQVRITVTDTGIGISRGDRERIFDRFYRSESTRNTEGTGLGLSIAKAVVEAHQGAIAVTSEVGQGSRFVVTMPRPG